MTQSLEGQLVVPNFCHFTIIEAVMLLGKLKALERVLYFRPDLCLITFFFFFIMEVYRKFHGPVLGFCPDIVHCELGVRIHSEATVALVVALQQRP